MPTTSRPEPEPQALDVARLLRLLSASRQLATRVEVLAQCVSTNDHAREAGAAGEHLPGTLFSAEEQQGGRGRRSRDWWSGPEEQNLALTLIAEEGVVEAPVFGLLSAVALADVLESWPGQKKSVALKWPNDLLLDGAKVAGFLGELMTGREGQAGCLMLGLGINLRAAPPAQIAPYRTTSLHVALEQGTPAPDRTLFLAQWLWQLERRLRQFQCAGPEAFEQRFLTLLRRWAPHGIHEEHSDVRGPLLEFSLADGLLWGPESAPIRRPLSWLTSLHALTR